MPNLIELEEVFVKTDNSNPHYYQLGRNQVIIRLFNTSCQEALGSRDDTILTSIGGSKTDNPAKCCCMPQFFLCGCTSKEEYCFERKTFRLSDRASDVRLEYVTSLNNCLEQTLGIPAPQHHHTHYEEGYAHKFLSKEFSLIKELLMRLITYGLSDEQRELPIHVLAPVPAVPDPLLIAPITISSINNIHLKAADIFVKKYIYNVAQLWTEWKFGNLTIWRTQTQQFIGYFRTVGYQRVFQNILSVKADEDLLMSNKTSISLALNNLNTMLTAIKQGIALQIFATRMDNIRCLQRVLVIDDLNQTNIDRTLTTLLAPLIFTVVTKRVTLAPEALAFAQVARYSSQTTEMRAQLTHSSAPVDVNLIQREFIQNNSQLPIGVGENSLMSSNFRLAIKEFFPENKREKMLKLFELMHKAKLLLMWLEQLASLRELLGWVVFISGTINFQNLSTILEKVKSEIMEFVILSHKDEIVARYPMLHAYIGQIPIQSFSFNSLYRIIQPETLTRVMQSISDDLRTIKVKSEELQALFPEMPPFYNPLPLEAYMRGAIEQRII